MARSTTTSRVARRRALPLVISLLMATCLHLSLPMPAFAGVPASKVIQVAEAELGNTDGTKYNETGAWCAAFMLWVYQQAGVSINWTSHCAFDERDVPQAQRVDKEKMRPGDAVAFDWDGDGTGDHVGIVKEMHDWGITTVEGNTSGRVANREHSFSDGTIICGLRPDNIDGSDAGGGDAGDGDDGGASGPWHDIKIDSIIKDAFIYLPTGQSGSSASGDDEGQQGEQHSDTVTDGTLTARQQAVIDACKTTPSPGGGLCAWWVEDVYERAGIGSWGGNACDLYSYYCDKSDKGELKPGMLVAVSSYPTSGLGAIYGHVAIYIGNNQVMENIGYINTSDLDTWIANYSGSVTPKWGWMGGVDLTR